MNRISTLVAVVLGAVLAAGISLVNVSASSAAADIVVTAVVRSNPDNSPHQVHWADSAFTRTMTIHDNNDGTHKVSTVDQGTFTTRKGEGSPNFNKPISRTLTGQYGSVGWGTITGELDPAYKDADGHVFDAKAGRKLNTAAWALSFFKAGATGHPFSGHYAFDYKTVDERWLETTETDQKNHPTAGDITGKLSSQLTVAGVCSTSTQAKYVVKNVRGDRARSVKYAYWVNATKHYSTPKWSADIAPGKSLTLTLGRGSLRVDYYDGYSQLRKLSAPVNSKKC